MSSSQLTLQIILFYILHYFYSVCLDVVGYVRGWVYRDPTQYTNQIMLFSCRSHDITPNDLKCEIE